MKKNLETIKKALQNHEELQDAVSFSKLKGEIKGFEKELRQQIENFQKGLSPEHDVCCVLCLEKGEIMKAKEILGDG